MYKLIRDRIPEIITEKGEIAPIRICQDRDEILKFLFLKIFEEAKEVEESNGDPSEIADLVEVLMAIAREKGIEWKEAEKIRLKKRDERGGFEKGYLLEL